VFAVLLSALLLASAGVPAKAGPGAPAPPTAAPAAKPDGPKLICWDEKPTGSHVSKRICATPEQLEKAHREGENPLATRTHGPKNSLSPG
jgi:hypothetical protein